MIAQKSSLLARFLVLCFFIFCALGLQAQLPRLDWALGTGSSGADQGDAVVIDAQGYAYAAGYHQAAADIDPGLGVVATTGTGMYIQKLDPQGQLIWAVDFAATGNYNIYDLALDAGGNLVAVGTFAGTVDFDPGTGTDLLTAQGGKDLFVLKLSGAGAYIFAKVAVSGTGADEVPRSLGTDALGNIVVAGWFTADADFDPSPGTAMRYSAGGLDAFVAKYDGSGNLVWANSIGSTSVDAVLDMTLDATGNTTAVGKFGVTVDFDPGVGSVPLTAAGNFDGFILRMDPNGNLLWARPFTTSPGNNCAPNSITTDALGNMLVAGTFFGAVDLDPGAGVANTLTTGLADMFVLKLDANGNHVWSWGFGGIYQDGLHDVATDDNGGVYVASIYEGTVDFDPGPGVTSATAITYKDIAVVKFSAGGAFRWAALAGGAQNDFIKQLRVSPLNDLYVTGSFIGSADFDPSSAVYSLSAVGASDAFLYRLDLCTTPLQSTVTDTTCGSFELNGIVYTSTGTYTQMLTGSLGCDSTITLHLTVTPLSVSTQASANMLTASPSGGTYQWLDCTNGHAVIPGATGQAFAPAASGTYAVIVNWQGCSDTSSCADLTLVGVPSVADAQITLSPNPASAQLRLSADIALGDVQIVNMLGQVVWAREGLLANEVLVDVSDWARGVYSLRMAADGGANAHVRRILVQ